jgi:hypothetical protein
VSLDGRGPHGWLRWKDGLRESDVPMGPSSPTRPRRARRDPPRRALLVEGGRCGKAQGERRRRPVRQGGTAGAVRGPDASARYRSRTIAPSRRPAPGSGRPGGPAQFHDPFWSDPCRPLARAVRHQGVTGGSRRGLPREAPQRARTPRRLGRAPTEERSPPQQGRERESLSSIDVEPTRLT